jgi:glutathione S-transferase
MDTMEALLQKNEGKYCFGDEVTLADCFFIPQI